MMWREVYWLTLTCSLHHLGTAFLQLFPGTGATIPIVKTPEYFTQNPLGDHTFKTFSRMLNNCTLNLTQNIVCTSVFSWRFYNTRITVLVMKKLHRKFDTEYVFLLYQFFCSRSMM
jgi:hypothetical protein